MDQYDFLKLENQLCFPLYVCAKEVVRAYKPYLDPLNLTYTQYITMMVLWQEKQISLRELQRRLYLEANTLSPLVKRLEEKGYLFRKRSDDNKKDLLIEISQKGMELREEAVEIPQKVASCLSLSQEQAQFLVSILNQLLQDLQNSD